MNSLKKLFTVAVMGLGLMASPVAFAQDSAPPAAPAAAAPPPGIGLTAGSTSLYLVGSTFNDLYWVSVTSPSNVVSYGVSSPFQFGPMNLPAVTFDSITMMGPTGLVGSINPATSSFTLAGSAITPGYYSLAVNGHSDAGMGAYALSVMVTAVPEPESYAMMLAGLGLLGFASRRRKQQEATA
jgi:hypothetical protein